MKNSIQQRRPKLFRPTVLHWLYLWIAVLTTALLASQVNAQQLQPNSKRQARILIISPAKIEVRTELYAPVLEIPFGPGHQFQSGDTLIRFDCSQYQAQKSAAAATAKAANIEYRTKRKLLKYQAAGKDEVRLAAAMSAKSAAELKVHQVRMTQCEYKAPFDGRIVNQIIRQFEFPPSDKPLLVILNDSKLELQLVVPSRWLRWIKKDIDFRFEIDETGQIYDGTITQLGAEVDPVSQTIEIFGKFKSDPVRALAGMSGTAVFAPGS